MNPRVKKVQPNKNFTLSITFSNGENRIFDVNPYLDQGVFKKLRDPKVFNKVRTFMGSVEWPGGQDFCPDTLYLASKSRKTPKH